MATNGRRIHVSIAAGCALALLAMTMGTALAAIPGTTPHHFSSHPMIAGTVVSVNDHQMVVNTDQGEQLTLELDSRTMAPRDLSPGMLIRTEFQALEDCRLYAERILPVRKGMSTERTQAYANTSDGHGVGMPGTTSTGVNRREHLPTDAANRITTPQVMEPHTGGNVMTAPPATRDHQFSNRPLLSGRVLAVNDHSLSLETEQGRRVALTMDSRTMVPAEVALGSYVRTEFSQMKDGRFYAKRVSLIGEGVAAREQAYAHTRDSEYLLTSDVPDCGYVSAPPANAVSAIAPPSEPVAPPPAVATPAPVPVAESPAAVAEEKPSLPQTASAQPLVLLLGLLLVGSAGLVAAIRRTRIG